MEEAGVVTSVWEESDRGPRRKKYLLNKNVSITLDLAPHQFTAKMHSFSPTPQSKKIQTEASSLLKRVEDIRNSPDEKTRISLVRTLLESLDEKIKTIEEERDLLVHVRDLAMQEANEAITTLQMEQEGRRILHLILDEQDQDAESISKALNLSESFVQRILSDFEKALRGEQ